MTVGTCSGQKSVRLHPSIHLISFRSHRCMATFREKYGFVDVFCANCWCSLWSRKFKWDCAKVILAHFRVGMAANVLQIMLDENLRVFLLQCVGSACSGTLWWSVTTRCWRSVSLCSSNEPMQVQQWTNTCSCQELFPHIHLVWAESLQGWRTHVKYPTRVQGETWGTVGTMFETKPDAPASNYFLQSLGEKHPFQNFWIGTALVTLTLSEAGKC